ncbi:MAG: aminotransferase class I/II-fold pyridoxal phosphate-dependent enzyme [Candidatus Omnitrophica bacterium]|nr:aminotransferase class I/II-fold pyridoxal phosphate-dependent enzyme [Candidatus Omnitrophota bacterium]
MKFIPRQNTFHFRGEFKLILQTILSGDWKYGKALSELEKKFAEYIGCKYAILVPSLTFGMEQILKLLLDKGDEVICPAFNYYSIPLAILSAKAKPVFADVNYKTFNINAEEIENKLTDKTKAIIVLHFGGQVADLNSILKIAKRHNLFVISDCAHACGAEYNEKKLGAIEEAACFSFGTGKNLDGFGGGIVTTNNDFLAGNIREAVNSLCCWPSLKELIIKIGRAYIQWLLMKPIFFHLLTLPLIWISSAIHRETDILYEIANLGSKKIPSNLSAKERIRFSNLQAKVVLEHLKSLDIRNEKVINNAHFLSKQLSSLDNVGLPVELPETKSVFLLYPIKVKDKWNLSFKLLKQGIDTRRKYFDVPADTCCPIAEKLAQETLYLPVYAELEKDDIIRIAETIRRILSE